MVTGIESFKEWFKGNESQYAIIGGTACDILMTEEGLDFRATKDIDLVLIIEAVDGARYGICAGADLQHHRQSLPQRETADRYHEPDPDGVEEPAGYCPRPYL